MKIITYIDLKDFEFWGGAKDWAVKFDLQELNDIQCALEDCYNECEETYINDLFWFEPEWLCELIGLDFEEFCER